MDKVYLVVMDWAFEGDAGIDIEVFATKPKALEAFRTLVNHEKHSSWIGENNGKKIAVEEQPERFEAIEVGRAQNVRTEIYIEEKEVKG